MCPVSDRSIHCLKVRYLLETALFWTNTGVGPNVKRVFPSIKCGVHERLSGTHLVIDGF